MNELYGHFLEEMATKQKLTPNEREIFLKIFSEGLRPDAISKREYRSRESISKTLGSVYSKFGLQSKEKGKEQELKCLLFNLFQEWHQEQLKDNKSEPTLNKADVELITQIIRQHQATQSEELGEGEYFEEEYEDLLEGLREVKNRLIQGNAKPKDVLTRVVYNFALHIASHSEFSLLDISLEIVEKLLLIERQLSISRTTEEIQDCSNDP